MTQRSIFGDEESWGRKGPSGEEEDIDITPMIDVTFLLLIFFMVASTMQGQKEEDLPTAVHGVGVDASEGVAMLEIRAPDSAGAEPEVIFDGQAGVSVNDLPSLVEGAARENRNHVIIKADRYVPHGFVQSVSRQIVGVEGATFSIGVRDKTE